MSNFFQRFFWSCAGVDIEVLDQCSSDHRKYTSIGVIIFLVASFASLAMYFAASTIIENKYSAIGVAILWGIMILMLDRLIVSTIRNDEDTTVWDKWVAAIPRIILAAIIATVISRPIEVQIFSEEINRQLLKDEIIEHNYVKEQLYKGSFLANLEKRDSLLEKEKKKLTEKQAMPEAPTAVYENLKIRKKEAENRLRIITNRALQADYINAKNSLRLLANAAKSDNNYYESYEKRIDNPNGSFSFIPDRKLQPQIEINKENWGDLVREIRNKRRTAERELQKIIDDMQAEYNAYKSNLSLTESELREQQDSIQTKAIAETTRIQEELSKYTEGTNDSIPTFFSKMKALSNLGYERDDFGNRGDTNLFWWAKWFILFLFFVIEISPVFVKIISPSGAYDEAFLKKQYSDQQIFKDNLEAKSDVANILRENWKQEQLKMYQSKRDDDVYAEI